MDKGQIVMDNVMDFVNILSSITISRTIELSMYQTNTSITKRNRDGCDRFFEKKLFYAYDKAYLTQMPINTTLALLHPDAAGKAKL